MNGGGKWHRYKGETVGGEKGIKQQWLTTNKVLRLRLRLRSLKRVSFGEIEECNEQ